MNYLKRSFLTNSCKSLCLMTGVSVILSTTAFAKDHKGNSKNSVPKHGWNRAPHKHQYDGQYNNPPYSNWNRNNQYYWNNRTYGWRQNGWRVIDNGPNSRYAPQGNYNNASAANGLGRFLNSLFR